MLDQDLGPESTSPAAGEAISQWDLVKVHTDNTLMKTTGVASADERKIGVAQEAIASGKRGLVRWLGLVATAKVKAAGAYAAGTLLYSGAGVATSDATSQTVIGSAANSSTAADDVITIWTDVHHQLGA